MKTESQDLIESGMKSIGKADHPKKSRYQFMITNKSEYILTCANVVAVFVMRQKNVSSYYSFLFSLIPFTSFIFYELSNIRKELQSKFFRMVQQLYQIKAPILWATLISLENEL